MVDEKDYLYVLKGIQDIPFSVGRKLLIAFLQGKENEKSIQKNKLNSKPNFGSLSYSDQEIAALIDNLILNSMIKIVSLSTNKFWKVLELSSKGICEIENPSLYKRKLAFNFNHKETTITEHEKQMFEQYTNLIGKFNDAQKKAIISDNKEILCLAGAGSGKTTVLTKRIEFLVKHKRVNPKKILAITFTRKARFEMVNRLREIPELNNVGIETFNSFCEKILINYNDLIYEQTVQVLSYRDKIKIINKALLAVNTNINHTSNIYFTSYQRAGKTPEQLANIFMNDCFFIRDYFKFKNIPLNMESFDIIKTNPCANIIYGVCNYIESYLKKEGLRDFADQLLDTITFFRNFTQYIPQYDYILIDEYQDINSTQIKLIDLLNPENIFCVGDPRQSIFGWRGSDIKHILNFEDKYPQAQIITLTKNYRSSKPIVDLINKSITKMGLANLEHNENINKNEPEESNIRLFNFLSEDKEFEFILQNIIASQLPKKEIFVLARTNRQLHDLSLLFRSRGIKYNIKSDEIKKSGLNSEDEVTLATIHGIKGLEAQMVFVLGCSSSNFPCKGSEHPVIEMIKIDEYDKEEEERRLFYVAMSRAKKYLYLTYTGKNPTYFIDEKMLEMLNVNNPTQSKISVKNNSPIHNNNQSKISSTDLLSRLKSWRLELSKELSVPAYIILNNRTLEEVALKSPGSINELEDIYGFGPTKIMKYGEDILSLVQG